VSSKKKSTSKSTSESTTTNTSTPFTSDESKARYNTLYDTTLDNYNNRSDLVNNLTAKVEKGGTIGDTSKFLYGWDQLVNQDNSNLNALNTMSIDPYDNENWVNAQKAIANNAKYQYGEAQNQVNQNIISSGMANGSGHQTAAANANAKLASQLAADEAERYENRLTQNQNTILQANQQLSDFNQQLAELGIDYAKLTAEDYETLWNAYSAQDQALQALGSAVGMGSDPTETSKTNASSTTTTKSSSGGLGNALGAVTGIAATGAKYGWFG